MSKKSVYSFCHWVSLIELSSWFGSISIHILSRIGEVREDEQVVEGLLGCALALYRLANANISVFVSEVSCSLSSYFLSIKSVTNLFRP